MEGFKWPVLKMNRSKADGLEQKCKHHTLKYEAKAGAENAKRTAHLLLANPALESVEF